MAFYIVAREGVTPAAADMLLGLTTGLQEIAKICDISVDGEAASAGINRMAIRRSSTNLITPTAQTPAKKSTTSPAAYTDASTTASTQPVTVAAPAVWARALQAYGGSLRVSLPPGQELLVQGATAGNNEVTLESTVGTNVITAELDFEEV